MRWPAILVLPEWPPPSRAYGTCREYDLAVRFPLHIGSWVPSQPETLLCQNQRFASDVPRPRRAGNPVASILTVAATSPPRRRPAILTGYHPVNHIDSLGYTERTSYVFCGHSRIASCRSQVRIRRNMVAAAVSSTRTRPIAMPANMLATIPTRANVWVER
jgi:hypothetical protein